MIAAKTGWTEKFLRWKLPLSRGFAYYHTARVMEGGQFIWSEQAGAVEEWVDSVRKWAASVS